MIKLDREDIREKALKDTREKLKSAPDRDRLMVKAVGMLDEEMKNFSSEMERFRDWYSLYFPELEDEITDDEHLVKILSDGIRKKELDSFSEMAENSTGMALPEKDLQMLESVFESVKDRMRTREEVEEYVEETAREEMPNLTKILGPLLSARITALAGGLEELAKKPSSTVQMLGAEKALFRYLKGEGTPPKHGILFEHSFVNSLPEEERGKMARFLANKAVMAARLDQYGEKDKGEELREECRKKYEELKQ